MKKVNRLKQTPFTLLHAFKLHMEAEKKMRKTKPLAKTASPYSFWAELKRPVKGLRGYILMLSPYEYRKCYVPVASLKQLRKQYM